MPDGCLLVIGLRESRRLRWLKFRAAVLEAGFVELQGSPGVFMVLDKKGQTCGLLVVHVDDGAWAGARKEFEQAKRELRALINIKVEKDASFEILGPCVEQAEEGIRVQQWDYVAKITPIMVPLVGRKCKDAPLTPQERTQYLSVARQLSWPDRATMPGLCYRASELQQRANKATVADLLKVNAVKKVVQQMARDDARL